jgi:hypothetical protein
LHFSAADDVWRNGLTVGAEQSRARTRCPLATAWLAVDHQRDLLDAELTPFANRLGGNDIPRKDQCVTHDAAERTDADVDGADAIDALLASRRLNAFQKAKRYGDFVQTYLLHNAVRLYTARSAASTSALHCRA